MQEVGLLRQVEQQRQCGPPNLSAQAGFTTAILSSKMDAAVFSTGFSGGVRVASCSGLSPGKIVFIAIIVVGTGLP